MISNRKYIINELTLIIFPSLISAGFYIWSEVTRLCYKSEIKYPIDYDLQQCGPIENEIFSFPDENSLNQAKKLIINAQYKEFQININ